jgi:hypothetical protein
VATRTVKQPQLSDINKIRKLAKKRGTPLLEVQFGKKKKSIHFYYQNSLGTGVLGFLYESREQGIERELKRLAIR